MSCTVSALLIRVCAQAEVQWTPLIVTTIKYVLGLDLSGHYNRLPLIYFYLVNELYVINN